MEEQEIELKFKAGDRVVQANSPGPVGTVRNVRVETTRTSVQEKDREPLGVTVTVLWDNGTQSHFVPDGLVISDK